MNDQPRAARYLRTNAVGNPQAQATDLARQKQVCDNVAAKHGLTIGETYEDICDPAMPAMDRLIADAQAGKVDIVVCSSMDRLMRNAEKLPSILESLDVVSLDGDTREMFEDRQSAAVISLVSHLASTDPVRQDSAEGPEPLRSSRGSLKHLAPTLGDLDVDPADQGDPDDPSA